MGLETIFIVFGVIVMLAIFVGLGRSRRAIRKGRRHHSPPST